MDFKTFLTSFRKYDPALVEGILSGYSILFEGVGNPILAYHGTNDRFDVFDPDKTQDSLFWFSTDKNSIASGESGAAGTKYIMTCLLSVNNSAGWDEYEKLTIDQLIAAGYDSVHLDNDYIVFDPEKIKVIDVESNGKSVLIESPIAYDEDTRKVADKSSKWSFLPPTHADVQTIHDWVKAAQNAGKLDSRIIGRGVDKLVLMNDGKTVFKFSQKDTDEQIYVEAGIYKKFGQKYGDLLAKIYKSGSHWCIQEYAEHLKNGVEFADLVGLTDAGLIYKDWHDMFYVGHAISMRWNDIREIINSDDAESMMKDAFPEIMKECKNFVRIARIPYVSRLFDFCHEAGVTLSDMTWNQFGKCDRGLVLFDYGMLME